MAVALLHAVEGVQAAMAQLDELRHRQIAEGMRRLPRIQQQPEVGGRDARRLEQLVLLHVVRHQVVVRRAAVLVEEAPGAQRHLAQKLLLLPVQVLPVLARRMVQPRGDGALEEPQHQQRRRHQQRLPVHDRDHAARYRW